MKRTDTVSTQASLWFGLLAGPLAWTLHELLSYALVRLACANNLDFLLHVVTLGSLAVAAAGVYIALRAYRTDTREDARFLAGAGVLVSGLFMFTIVMEGIPNAVVSPCL
jgi:hypothetical protein